MLCATDESLRKIVQQYGYPPLWGRPASFETLVHIILEQQVSLASALAAMVKLKEKLPSFTPTNFLLLSDEALKLCYFSRQKMGYCKHLATSIFNGELNLGMLHKMSNDDVRKELIKIKGIGNWTADIYLMMVLHRCDVFPCGDIALLTSIKEIKNLPKETSKETIAALAKAWQPYQTIAAFILWHAYLKKRNR